MSKNKPTTIKDIVEEDKLVDSEKGAGPSDPDAKKNVIINTESVSYSAANVKGAFKVNTRTSSRRHTQSISDSIANLKDSDESDDEEPFNCLNWFKMITSPQKKLLKKKQKREKSKKSFPGDLSTQNPVIDAEGFPIPGFGTVSNYYPYEQTIVGVFTDREPKPKVKAIDYASIAEEKLVPTFLSGHPCYAFMPINYKSIVLSVELKVKTAHSALISNARKAASLWDVQENEFIGMLTMSDFLDVLRKYYYASLEDITDLENQSVGTWRKTTNVEKSFVKVNTMDSLKAAAKLFIRERVHRIPVINGQDVTFVLTPRKLLKFLSNRLFDNFGEADLKAPSFFRKAIRNLGIGTFRDIVKVQRNTKVITALDLLMDHKVSSLPVVNKAGVLLDIFEKFDVFQLTKDQTYYDLDMPISDAITTVEVRELAWICTLDESFGTVIKRFVNNKAHRMVVVDEKRVVIGIISLSDVLKFLVVDPSGNSGLSSAPETIEEGAVGGLAQRSSLESFNSCLDLSSDGFVSIENLEINEFLSIKDSESDTKSEE